MMQRKKAISEDDSCVCGGTGITCGDKDFNFKEIKENAPKIDDSTSGTDEISTSGISVESCDAAKAFLIKNKMIESNTSCECDIEDAITCGTETFYFEKIGNKKEEKLQTEPVKPKQPVKTTENININRTIDYSSIDTEISNSISIKNPKAQCSGNAQYTGNNVWKHICTNITFNITISGINCGDNKQWNKSNGKCDQIPVKPTPVKKTCTNLQNWHDYQYCEGVDYNDCKNYDGFSWDLKQVSTTAKFLGGWFSGKDGASSEMPYKTKTACFKNSAQYVKPGLGESLQKGMEAKSQRMGAFGF